MRRQTNDTDDWLVRLIVMEAKRYWMLPIIREMRGRSGALYPTINIRQGRKKELWTSGHAYYYPAHIALTMSSGRNVPEILTTTIHEIVHITLFEYGEHQNKPHGQLFRRTMTTAIEEAFDIRLNPRARQGSVWVFGGYCGMRIASALSVDYVSPYGRTMTDEAEGLC